jgi:flagellar biosynthesis chaperone FliJ
MLKQYTAIAKVKRQLLDLKEAALLEARLRVGECEEALASIVNQINDLQVPQKGTYQELLHVKAIKEQLMRQKMYALEARDLAQNRANECLYHFNEAKREFEKVKYLQENAYSKALKHLQKQEQSNLDEVALQLYVLQGGRT